VRGKAAGNPFGFALQVIDVDRIDTDYNVAAQGDQRQVRMGVGIDAYGRPVYYWLRTYHPGDMWMSGEVAQGVRRVRVPAADIIHRFVADRPEQLRGVPWMHAGMVQLNNLVGYEEAAIIAARVGASKMGFFTSPDGDPTPLADGADEDTDIPYTDADPGTFGTLPQGYGFQPFNPDYPHAMFGDFVKAALRGVASGFDVTYHSLGNDLTGVSFSSIRSGTLEERDLWMSKQAWFVDCFLEPVYREWLRMALAMGQITAANGSQLPIEKLEKFSAHVWQPRRWQWVDPLKDIEAARLAIKTGVASPQMIAAQNGVDIEDVLDQIAAFEQRVKDKGVTMVSLDDSMSKPAPVAAVPLED
jgi:lambda family phage portal protein